MNELLFFTHLITIGIATLLMLRLGSHALSAFLCVQAILANLFVLKQISLFGLAATASDIYIVGSVFSLNLIQEYYGKPLARKTIWISFCLLVFYTIVSQIHIIYVPNLNDFSQIHFQSLLTYMPRITTASIIVYLMVQYFDTYFYGLLSKVFKSKYVILRNLISITVSQLLDTLLFSFLGLYGILDEIVQIMFVSFTIKIITMLFLAPIVLLIKRKIIHSPI